MKNLYRILIVAGFGLVLSACAGMQLDKAKMMKPGGSEFDKNLYAGYVGLSSGEYQEGDYKDSDQFANRAMVAGAGKKVGPEAMTARNLPEKKVGELSDARKWLKEALDKGAATKAPKAAAQAQVGFDCWMQEQEENFQPADIAACRKMFLAGMGMVEAAMATPAPKMEKKTTMVRPEKPEVDGIYVLFFDFDKSNLNAAAQEVVRKAIFDYHLTKPGKVYLSGHADTRGAASYNLELSKRRLETVVGAMTGSQVSGDNIETEAFGETKPLVMSGDGKKEPKNRRVEIIFE
jgi:outer membrane protein OmpA-like peptidoglycan-associated protein